jgi:hypothetical protein
VFTTIASGRRRLVPEGRRHATIDTYGIIEAIGWALSFTCRAGLCFPIQ